MILARAGAGAAYPGSWSTFFTLTSPAAATLTVLLGIALEVVAAWTLIVKGSSQAGKTHDHLVVTRRKR